MKTLPSSPQIPISSLSNDELIANLSSLIRSERKITRQILELIELAEMRRLYLEQGYPSLFEWLTKYFGYSESAAYRRLQAARLISTLSEAGKELQEKIESGTLTLSTLAKAQSFFRAEEKRSGGMVPSEVKVRILEKVENQSLQKTEKLLFQFFPEAAKSLQAEKISAVSETESRLSLVLSEEVLNHLKRVQELLGHALPEGSLGEVIAYLSKEFLKRKDPLLKKAGQRKTMSSGSLVQSGKLAQSERLVQSENAAQPNGEASSESLTQPDSQAQSESLAQPDRSTQSDGSPHPPGSAKDAYAPRSESFTHSEISVSPENTAAVLHGGGMRAGKLSPQRKPLSVSLRRFILQRDQGRCQFMDPRSGKVCGSRRRVEIDHIRPVALGGEDLPANLRCLCRNHNQWRARRTFAGGSACDGLNRGT